MCLVVLGACQVRTEVTVQLEEDGSGTVEVAVGLDDEALTELPDLDQDGVGDAADLSLVARVDDLEATGWTIGEPESEDGVTWIRATKPFGTPEQAVEVLDELTGPEGPLREWDVKRQRSFGQTEFRVAGIVDLSAGLEAFGDAGLAQGLDGEPFGEDVTLIEQRYGQPIGDLVGLELAVVLPGATESWTPELGSPAATIEARSTRYDWPVLLLAGAAVACFLALTGVLGYPAFRSARR